MPAAFSDALYHLNMHRLSLCLCTLIIFPVISQVQKVSRGAECCCYIMCWGWDAPGQDQFILVTKAKPHWPDFYYLVGKICLCHFQILLYTLHLNYTFLMVFILNSRRSRLRWVLCWCWSIGACHAVVSMWEVAPGTSAPTQLTHTLEHLIEKFFPSTDEEKSLLVFQIAVEHRIPALHPNRVLSVQVNLFQHSQC